MRILIADDDPKERTLLDSLLTKWGHETWVVSKGNDALQLLKQVNAPCMALLDWMMPEMDGPTVCQEIRQYVIDQPLYLILVTARNEKEDIVEGLRAGADDYVVKPYDVNELKARIQVGERLLNLQLILADRMRLIEESLNHIKRLQGLLPICSYCKKVQGDQQFWQEIEAYIAEHSELEFTHGVCPQCKAKILRPE